MPRQALPDPEAQKKGRYPRRASSLNFSEKENRLVPVERLGLFDGGIEAVPYGTAFNGEAEPFAVTLAVLLLRHEDVDGALG